MRRFERVIFASDIDGTFLAKTEEGRKRNREAIAYFKSRGGKFTFSTGRNHRQVLDAVPQCAELVNFPAVTCNGACLYDFSRGEELRRYLLEYPAVRDLIVWLGEREPTVGVRGAGNDCFWFSSLDNPYIRKDYGSMSAQRRRVAPIEEWREAALYKLAVRAEESILAALRPAMTEAFRGRLEITQSDPTLIDVQQVGRTKAALLGELVRQSGIEAPILCVAGDYDNDLEMLRMGDLALCPSNARECVASICHRRFCHCDEGAVAEMIAYLDQKYEEGSL